MTFAGKDATEEFDMIHPPDVIEKYAPSAIIGAVGSGGGGGVKKEKKESASGRLGHAHLFAVSSFRGREGERKVFFERPRGKQRVGKLADPESWLQRFMGDRSRYSWRQGTTSQS